MVSLTFWAVYGINSRCCTLIHHLRDAQEVIDALEPIVVQQPSTNSSVSLWLEDVRVGKPMQVWHPLKNTATSSLRWVLSRCEISFQMHQDGIIGCHICRQHLMNTYAKEQWNRDHSMFASCF